MYDVVIIGGGLSGLVSAIRLANAGQKVALIERHAYPFHRVCGEYISNEVLPFLHSLGFDPFDHGAVAIKKFQLSAPGGSSLHLDLPLGGFGISRYRLDHLLYELGVKSGVDFLLQQKAQEVLHEKDVFRVKTNKQEVTARMAIGAFGKRSNLDQYYKRAFFSQRSPWVGVKYHIRFDHSEEWIALHNFKDGYCGMSRVEDGKSCLCYLVSRKQVRKHGSISALEEKLLRRNPFLDKVFREAEFLYDKPEVINEVSFAPKPLIEQGLFTVGDAAGMIAPLCGNGMAMAIHGAKILTDHLILFQKGKIDRATLERDYQRAWKRQFSSRLRLGRTVQGWFGSPVMTAAVVQSFKLFPPLARLVVKNTHGEPF